QPNQVPRLGLKCINIPMTILADCSTEALPVLEGDRSHRRIELLQAQRVAVAASIHYPVLIAHQRVVSAGLTDRHLDQAVGAMIHHLETARPPVGTPDTRPERVPPPASQTKQLLQRRVQGLR